MRLFSLVFLMLFFTIDDIHAQTTYPVMLSGLEQVPPVRTPATGEFEVYVESDTLYVRGQFSDLRGHYWSAFVHYGAVGEEGNRLFRLSPDELNEEQNAGTFIFEDNKFHLRELQREALREGNMYINISSNRNQEGEIRGQIPTM